MTSLSKCPFCSRRFEAGTSCDCADAVIARMEAENKRLNDYLTARVNSCHEMQNKMEMAGNVIDDLAAELEKVRAELEKCQQDAFNSGRDVQHRIDGRASAGFAELEY